MWGLNCGHTNCAACWRDYLSVRMVEEDASAGIQCPGTCQTLVSDQSVLAIVNDPYVKKTYQKFIVDSFVQSNQRMTWCPSGDCRYVIKVKCAAAGPARCWCGHQFCLSCGQIWHGPVPCNLFKSWIRKCDGDQESRMWMSSNTKQCPKCAVRIEKRGGCNL